MEKTFSTDLNGNTIIVNELNTNKLKQLDINFTGIKFEEGQMQTHVRPKKSSKITKNTENDELSYHKNKPLVPFLALL